jgi:HD-like signal output (HDOD) protein
MILDGLRNLLRKYRGSWAMDFVTSGTAALEHLARHGADIVVSDMRMPGMDGAQLLQKVREHHPATARIVLTGQASKDDLLQVLPVAQQILAKPCEPKVLCATIERMFKVQALLGNPQLQALVGGLERLPSFPKCYERLSQAMHRDDATVAEIARIVEQDPALSVKALSMANAAYFGLAQPTASIPIAVRHIGFALLRALALSTDIFASISASLLSSDTLRQLPERALLRAQLARCYVIDRSRAEEAFTAALMLDIGMIVLAQRQGDEYLQLLQVAEESTLPLHEVERERLGYTHAEVGAYLLGVWGLPAELVEMVASHHAPALRELSANPVAAAVHLADVFTDPSQREWADPAAGLLDAIRDRPEIAARLREWRALAQPAIESR